MDDMEEIKHNRLSTPSLVLRPAVPRQQYKCDEVGNDQDTNANGHLPGGVFTA